MSALPVTLFPYKEETQRGFINCLNSLQIAQQQLWWSQGSKPVTGCCTGNNCNRPVQSGSNWSYWISTPYATGNLTVPSSNPVLTSCPTCSTATNSSAPLTANRAAATQPLSNNLNNIYFNNNVNTRALF